MDRTTQIVATAGRLDVPSGTRQRTKKAIKERGEVFTPERLVEEMLARLPADLFADPRKTFLDNSCGNGAFLTRILMRKMENGIPHPLALETIYGVEIDPQNAEECRQRLLLGCCDPRLRGLVDYQIVCADALDPAHTGWRKVGFYWSKEESLTQQLVARKQWLGSCGDEVAYIKENGFTIKEVRV